MGAFTGQLNRNEIYNSLFNMIISQQIFDDRISEGEDLVDMARVDGSLYGDTKLYYSTDVLATKPWTGDAEAPNLLEINRAKDPEVQAITLDQFRFVPLTLDNYLSKRAWSDEGTFSQFNSIMEGQLAKTKYIYSLTHYNVFLGTSSDADHTLKVNKEIYGTTPEAEVKAIADAVANAIDRICRVSTKNNDYGQHTKFKRSDITIVWNTAVLNKFRKVDMPAIFHKDMLFDADIKQRYLDATYWGKVSDVTTVPAEGVYRATKELDIDKKHYFAGEQIPAGSVVSAGDVYVSECGDDELQPTSDNICIILVKYPPYMSAFEEGTSFWNPRSLTTNRYLIWGENTLEYLKAYPHVLISSASN